MLLGFQTKDEVRAKAAMIIYVIYKSRDPQKGPSGLDMWGQIERFAKATAKRSEGIGEFTNDFKRKMACSTINPYWMKNNFLAANAIMLNGNAEIISFENEDLRSFGLEIFENEEKGKEIVECIYNKTQIIILLVRDRLEREKLFEKGDGGNEN